MTDPTDNQEIEAAELAVRGLGGMTDADLDRIDEFLRRGFNTSELRATARALLAEVRRLRLMNEGLVGRCAACADVLSRVANRLALVCPQCGAVVKGEKA